MERQHYMYVVECADGSWYTGYSTNVERRVAAHNAGRGAKYTRARLPVRLLASAGFSTKHEAMSAEARFKRLGRARKEELVAAALRAGGCLTDVLLEEFDGRLTAMSSENITIRLATEADLDAVTRIEAACFLPAEAASREQFAERLAAFASHFWLLELDGEPVAMINGMVCDDPLISDEMFADASLHREDGAWQEIFGVATLPEHQHRGYASLLMERVIADCRAQGRRGCVLTCKERLLGFYERFGYVNLGVSASQHGGAVWYDMRLEY